MTYTRRDFLKSMTAAGAVMAMPQLALAKADTQQRFVLVLQRGAADGLNTVIPYADPNYQKLRKSIAMDVRQATKLDGTFALHGALQETAKLYQQKQAMFIHAVASPYRQRSHFDGQNVLETGGISPYQMKDGWLNRLLTLLPNQEQEAIAIAPFVPMALRGKVNVASYAPSRLPDAADDLMLRAGDLYAQDPQLHAAWTKAMDIESMATPTAKKADGKGLGKLAGGFLARDDGPRIAILETNGWDTHNAQNNRLNRQLTKLDQLIAALKTSMGDAWQHTTVLICTEFGRTAAVNGTQGTDHGTGAVAMLLGGGLNGGRVMADWPGLAPSQLYQGRDLQPTLDLNTLIASVLAETYQLAPEKLSQVLFPQLKLSRPLTGFYA